MIVLFYIQVDNELVVAHFEQDKLLLGLLHNDHID
jgi:hypothetical protein